MGRNYQTPLRGLKDAVGARTYKRDNPEVLA